MIGLPAFHLLHGWVGFGGSQRQPAEEGRKEQHSTEGACRVNACFSPMIFLSVVGAAPQPYTVHIEHHGRIWSMPTSHVRTHEDVPAASFACAPCVIGNGGHTWTMLDRTPADGREGDLWDALPSVEPLERQCRAGCCCGLGANESFACCSSCGKTHSGHSGDKGGSMRHGASVHMQIATRVCTCWCNSDGTSVGKCTLLQDHAQVDAASVHLSGVSWECILNVEVSLILHSGQDLKWHA